MASNKYLFSGSEDQLKLLGQLLKPSWLSGLAVVVVSIAVVIGSAFTLYYQGSDIQLLQKIQSSKPRAISQNYSTLDRGFSTSALANDLPLFILWGGVGVVAYTFTTSIYGAFRRAIDFEHELDYVHANRDQLLKEAAIKLLFRLLMLVAWFLYIKFTLHVLLPYVVALAYAGSDDLGLLQSTGYLSAATGLLTIGAHLHVVLLRLALLKPRAFGQFTK